MKREFALAAAILALIGTLAAMTLRGRSGGLGSFDVGDLDKALTQREALLGMLDGMAGEPNNVKMDENELTKRIEKKIGDMAPMRKLGNELEIYAFRLVAAGENKAEASILFKCDAAIINDYTLTLFGFLDSSNADQLSARGHRWPDGNLVEDWAIGGKDAFFGAATSRWVPGHFYFLKGRIDNIRHIPYRFAVQMGRDSGRDTIGEPYAHIGWHAAL